MAITSEIRIIRESPLTRLTTAIARWSTPRDAQVDREALEDRLLMNRELEAWKRELDRTNALQRSYRGV